MMHHLVVAVGEEMALAILNFLYIPSLVLTS
jgi:hypothetical protein